MKNLKKKGFTIVELVIVIAVIAVLAAVLIPTFVNLTRKANLSADTVIAKEINTIIAVENASDEFEGFEDVIEALYSNGFYLANLNTKTEGCFFIWDSETNKMLLVDAKDNFKVLFPESGYTAKGSSWHLVCSDMDLLADIETDGMVVNYAVSSADSLNQIIAAGTSEPIFVDKNFEIKEGSAIAFKNGAEATLILGDSSLSTEGTINGAPVYVSESTLTIQGGTLNATGEFSNENGTFNCAIGYDGGAKLTIIDVNFIGITGINGTMNGANDGHDVELVVENSTFEVSGSGVILSTGNGTSSTAEINNCTISADKYAIFTSQGGTITVNGGTYKGDLEVIHSQDAGTKVIVNSGTFVGPLSASGGGQIIINGGTFSVDPTSYLADGCEATQNADGMWVVTSANK